MGDVNYKLAPSILAADLTRLGEQIREADQAGADYIHIDVMDGDFVPCISFGMPVIKAIRSITEKTLDVHLMVSNPERYIPEFIECGADLIVIHVEACRHLEGAVTAIRECGKKAGVALNPGTSLHCLEYILDKVDMVLLMTVNPGLGGQKYIEASTRKIKELRQMIRERGLNVDIEVDGGIGTRTIEKVLEAGANVIVSGTAIFPENILENIEKFKEKFRVFEQNAE